jgi:hypothetical protein
VGQLSAGAAVCGRPHFEIKSFVGVSIRVNEKDPDGR